MRAAARGAPGRREQERGKNPRPLHRCVDRRTQRPTARVPRGRARAQPGRKPSSPRHDAIGCDPSTIHPSSAKKRRRMRTAQALNKHCTAPQTALTARAVAADPRGTSLHLPPVGYVPAGPDGTRGPCDRGPRPELELAARAGPNEQQEHCEKKPMGSLHSFTAACVRYARTQPKVWQQPNLKRGVRWSS